jgi:malate dehydrogenase (oxaloacetate-decarboxylating)(NADP+)
MKKIARLHDRGRTKPCATQRDVLACRGGRTLPGHRQGSRPAYEYTNKGNLVAVVSNGTAVLGLGNIGPSPASR